MSLLCALGWHRPKPLARWNQGYYFSSCRSCGRDLIRIAFESWHVPRGYRVVWSATPSKSQSTAALIPKPEDRSPPSDEASGTPPADVAQGAVVDRAPETLVVAQSEASAVAVAPRAPDGDADGCGTLPITEVLELLREEELRPSVEIDGSAHHKGSVYPVAEPPGSAETLQTGQPASGPSDEFMAEPADPSPGSGFWDGAGGSAAPAGKDATPPQADDSSGNEARVEQAMAGPAEPPARDHAVAEQEAPVEPGAPALELTEAQAIPPAALDKATEVPQEMTPRRRVADWRSAAQFA